MLWIVEEFAGWFLLNHPPIPHHHNIVRNRPDDRQCRER